MVCMGSSDTKVLIVDDDADLRAALTDFISKMGVKVRTAGSVEETQHLLHKEAVPFDLVLTDLKIPGGSGLDVLRAAHSRSMETLVTIITGYASIETAIDAIRLGAYNYVTKPFSLNEIGVQVRNMIERVALSKENARLSLRLQELYQQVNRVQNERTDVLRSNEDLSKKLDQILNILKADVQSQPMRSEAPASNRLLNEVDTLDRVRELATASRI